MMRPGPKNLITDVPGILVGNASDDRLKSGVTVLTSDTAFRASVDVRGGAPGSRETDLLAPGKTVDAIDALVLSGGSAFGLDAASGVTDALRSQGRGVPTLGGRVPIVPAAILYDLANGGAKTWEINPYRELGKLALLHAGEDFALGTAGAGTGANAGRLKGGLGSASLVLKTGATVGALVAVNSRGGVIAPGGRSFWAGPFEIGGEFGGLGASPHRADPFDPLYAKPSMLGEAGNTVIAIVATDQQMDKTALKRVAEIAHDGMARAIYPAHTPTDGDLVFSVSTGTTSDAATDPFLIEHAAANCLTRAIARAVYAATPAEGDPFPCWSELGDEPEPAG